jgi:hypothetical protein
MKFYLRLDGFSFTWHRSGKEKIFLWFVKNYLKHTNKKQQIIPCSKFYTNCRFAFHVKLISILIKIEIKRFKLLKKYETKFKQNKKTKIAVVVYRVNRESRFDLPTPLSPIKTTI